MWRGYLGRLLLFTSYASQMPKKRSLERDQALLSFSSLFLLFFLSLSHLFVSLSLSFSLFLASPIAHTYVVDNADRVRQPSQSSWEHDSALSGTGIRSSREHTIVGPVYFYWLIHTLVSLMTQDMILCVCVSCVCVFMRTTLFLQGGGHLSETNNSQRKRPFGGKNQAIWLVGRVFCSAKCAVFGRYKPSENLNL